MGPGLTEHRLNDAREEAERRRASRAEEGEAVGEKRRALEERVRELEDGVQRVKGELDGVREERARGSVPQGYRGIRTYDAQKRMWLLAAAGYALLVAGAPGGDDECGEGDGVEAKWWCEGEGEDGWEEGGPLKRYESDKLTIALYARNSVKNVVSWFCVFASFVWFFVLFCFK